MTTESQRMEHGLLLRYLAELFHLKPSHTYLLWLDNQVIEEYINEAPDSLYGYNCHGYVKLNSIYYVNFNATRSFE